MFFRGIVTKYTVDLILLIKFKKGNWYIGKVFSFPFGIFTPNPIVLWWFFCLKFHILQCFLSE